MQEFSSTGLSRNGERAITATPFYLVRRRHMIHSLG